MRVNERFEGLEERVRTLEKAVEQLQKAAATELPTAKKAATVKAAPTGEKPKTTRTRKTKE